MDINRSLLPNSRRKYQERSPRETFYRIKWKTKLKSTASPTHETIQ